MVTVMKNEIVLKLFYYFFLIDWNLVSNEINFDDQEPYSKIIKVLEKINNQIS